jgi:hypothetical protein
MFSAGNPTKVFDTRYWHINNSRTYDVSPDGQRFLMIKDAATGQGTEAPTINVVLHWSEELKQRVRTK